MTDEGTVVEILLGIVGSVIGGWLFTLFDDSGLSGFNLDSVYSAGIAAIGAIIALARCIAVPVKNGAVSMRQLFTDLPVAVLVSA